MSRQNRPTGAPGLLDFCHECHFYYGGFLLPRRKSLSLLMVGIEAGETFSILIKQRYLPMAMFPPLILSKFRALEDSHPNTYNTIINCPQTNSKVAKKEHSRRKLGFVFGRSVRWQSLTID
jgi:hypothetical protein